MSFALPPRRSIRITYGEPKGKHGTGNIDIPATLVALLKEHKEKQEEIKQEYGEFYQDYNLVCCRSDGVPINNSSLSSRFRRLARKDGLNISFHNLRHYVELNISGIRQPH